MQEGESAPGGESDALTGGGEQARRSAVLLDKIELARLQAGEALSPATGPLDHQPGNAGGRADAEVNPVAGLGKEAFPAAQGADASGWGRPFKDQLQAGSDGIAVAAFPIPPKLEGDEVLTGRSVIGEEADAGRAAIGDPDVEIPIKVPVDRGKSATIVRKTESGESGYICKARLFATGVEEGAVAFVAAEGAVLVQEAAQGAPSLLVGGDGGSGEIIDGGLRHDLPPVDTSQVTCVRSSDEAIGDQDIVPAVIVEIDEL